MEEAGGVGLGGVELEVECSTLSEGGDAAGMIEVVQVDEGSQGGREREGVYEKGRHPLSVCGEVVYAQAPPILL